MDGSIRIWIWINLMTFYGLNSQTMMKLLPYNNDTAPTTCKIFPFKISTKLKKTEAKTTVIKNWLHTPKSLIEIETFVENSYKVINIT